MPSCKFVLDALSEYIDGRLSDTHKVEIDKHLTQCSKCHTVFNDVKAVKQSLSHIPRIRTGPYFQPVLNSRLSRQSQHLHNRTLNFFSGLRARAVYATAAVLILSVFLLKPDLLPFQKPSGLSSSERPATSVRTNDGAERVVNRDRGAISSTARPQSRNELVTGRSVASSEANVSLIQRKKNAIIYF